MGCVMGGRPCLVWWASRHDPVQQGGVGLGPDHRAGRDARVLRAHRRMDSDFKSPFAYRRRTACGPSLLPLLQVFFLNAAVPVLFVLPFVWHLSDPFAVDEIRWVGPEPTPVHTTHTFTDASRLQGRSVQSARVGDGMALGLV